MRPSLLILAFDHRNSYERALPGATVAQYERGKILVADAVNDAVAKLGTDSGVGLLTDLQFGRDAVRALDRNAVSALAIEKSGQAVFDFEFGDWPEALIAADATYAKVLIRYRADDAEEDRDLQARRLHQVAEFCAGSEVDFLLEIITPLTAAEQAAADNDLDSVRLPLLVAAIADLQQRGIDPEVWKVEGLDRADSCATVADQARVHRDDVQLVVLGAGAGAETVNRWLRSAAEGGYNGFAVGRSIWKEPLERWFADGDETAARAEVLDRYLGYIGTFQQAVG